MGYKVSADDYQNALLRDAFVMMEHGKMSLKEALTIGLSFVEMYKKSDSFEAISKRLESERIYKTAVIDRLNQVIKVTNGRR